MTSTASISEHLERQSVVSMESTIPSEMTVGEWRRRRSARAGAARRRSRVFAAARRVVPLRPIPCDHLHDTTTRYDPVEKLLTFLLICPVVQHREGPRDPALRAALPVAARELHPGSGMTIASESR